MHSPLKDAPKKGRDLRMPSPTRNAATKRRESIHNEEPDLKTIIRWEDSDDMEEVKPDVKEATEMSDDSLADALFDDDESIGVLTEAVLGKDICYSFGRPTGNGIGKVDIAELFSPHRITKLCEQFWLKAGMALDLKTG